ncbi:MAG TPA: ABC transporter permease [Casimicrobiaceae bacterium]|nr:ABC transporter permease [Casimicrobiaceae bacterium]
MNTWQALRWTLRSTLFDKGALVPIVGGIILYSFFYPLPYLPQVVRAVPVAVADYDASSLSRKIARDLDATQAVRVAGVTANVEAAIPFLQRGEIGGIVAVPPNFRRDVLRGTPTGVTVMGNGGYIVVDGTVLETTAQVVAEAAAPALAAQLVRANVPPAAVMRLAHAGPAFIKQPLFNTVQGYEGYVVPASMGLIVHQLLLIGICIVIGTWVEGGRWAIVADKQLSVGAFTGMLAGFWLLAFAALMFWIGFVFWFHDLPRAANMSGAIVFCALYALAIAAVGVALGCWMGERERALQIIGGISIPLLFLSGFAFPVESISQPLVWLSHLLPTTPGIQGLLKLNQMDASWAEVQPQVINLLLLVLAYVAVAWWAAGRCAIRPAQPRAAPPVSAA